MRLNDRLNGQQVPLGLNGRLCERYTVGKLSAGCSLTATPTLGYSCEQEKAS